MSCDFKIGDEVVCVDADTPSGFLRYGAVYVVADVRPVRGWLGNRDGWSTDLFGVEIVGWPMAFHPNHFRKVQKRKDSLTIEAFMTIKDGFEEPKRAPAKKRGRVQ